MINKNMPNYNTSKIYKLVCDTTNKQYIGSTIQTLPQRLSAHKYNYKNNLEKYSSTEIFKNNNYRIELLENYYCNTKEELLKRERYYIENNDCINKNIPICGRNESQLRYSKKNKEILRQKASEKITCECGGIFRKDGLSRHVLTTKHINFITN